MATTQINIACGDSYIDSWNNFDYSPHSATVKRANLLESLPVPDSTATVVYSSHFFEHIPRDQVTLFLAECYRIAKSGGRLRLVLPDWEILCSIYLTERQIGHHEKADFLMLEMIDQCVRMRSGGELGAYYSYLQASQGLHKDMIEYVRQMTGHLIQSAPVALEDSRWYFLLKNPTRILSRLERLYCRTILSLLPSAFRRQNVSLATVGERHAWMYDFYTVEQLLRQTGFVNVQRMSATASNISGFPFYPLDVSADGQPRKGVESMYIEAVKP